MKNDPCAIILIGLYCWLFTLCLLQTAKSYISSNKRLTLRIGVIYALILSSLIRIIFWLHIVLPSYWHHQILLLIYVLPVWTQIVGLSLLVLYYAQVLGKSTSNVPLRLCIFGNTIFLFICIVLSVSSEASAMKEIVQHALRSIFVAVASFFSFLIAGLLGYFGQKFSEFHKTEKVNRSLLPHSVQKFHMMNLILVLIFVLRGLLIILSATHNGNFPSDTKVVETDSHSHVTHLEMAYFLIIEILPYTFVLLTLWQPLCPKDPLKKSIDGADLCNHSEMNAKYNDMFSPRGSQISRDGDDVVRVVYSTFLMEQQKAESDDHDCPSLSLSLSPMSPMQRKINSTLTPPMNQITNGTMIQYSNEATADLTSPTHSHYPPRMPLPIGKRPLIIPPHILRQSDDNIGEERPSDAHELQYYHPNLSLDQIIPNTYSYSSSNPSTDNQMLSSPHGKFPYSFNPQYPSADSSLTSGGSAPSPANWLIGPDSLGQPPLHRSPSAPTASAMTDSSNLSYNPIQHTRPPFIPGSGSPSPRQSSSLSSSEEKARLEKQFAKELSPKYILQSRIGSPKPRSNSGS